MLGAITGDIVGSPYEYCGELIEADEFPLFSPYSEFTDDTVMTVAIAEALMKGGGDRKKTRSLFITEMRKFGRFYPNAGYGGLFAEWLCREDEEGYGSFGNGSAMRVSPVAWFFDDLQTVEEFAELSASVTHDHPEGIKGAQAIAAAIFLARTGKTKEEIRTYIEKRFGYDLDHEVEEFQRMARITSSCQVTVPEAIVAFLEGENFEDVIRRAVSIGGDTDTLAAMAGSIAEAFYSIDDEIRQETMKRLSPDLRSVVEQWNAMLREKRFS
ncbi:MAG: ADP-ribosylglycohydrolase family protein [Firmicutes bacterium]|nr:ADP-ribosylglycohydrolase family protein [Bacillota bacterium]